MSTLSIDESELIRASISACASSQHSQTPAIPLPAVLVCLTTLPWELQLEIASHLDVRNIILLRQTCHLYRDYFTVDAIDKLFTNQGRVDELRFCCYKCLTIPASRDLVLDKTRGPNQWRSLCFICWRIDHSPSIHDATREAYDIQFSNNRHGHVCLWCGWPTFFNYYHVRCGDIFDATDNFWWCMASLRCTMLAVVSGTIWFHYTGNYQVVIPAMLNFFTSFVVVFLVSLYYFRWGCTTPLRVPIEVMMTLAWIPAVVYAAQDLANNKENPDQYSYLVCTVFVARCFIYFLNLLCEAMLVLGYNPRDFAHPGISERRKLLYVFCSFMVYWGVARYRRFRLKKIKRGTV
ncbi:uncharacterized protein F4822DRAFT_428533 [Hypoxylon trugodes]|uniref:uncharacterized protein n=1 Tax=Hypoxylon trugodes TaxID=326681 RepID=UPI00219DA558|nr:uncharacterized protein F4822DRAFT_428533 [Hypoxylon trugodes]KAI1390191.1 hypothetical protein F4822DRAFT_428533 [Hypoxylon trugodes]